MTKSFSAPLVLYSYGPWFISSHSLPKPSTGAGEANVHSSVQQSQGLAVATGPFRKLQNKFTSKMSCPASVAIAATVTTFCNGAIAATYCTPLNSEYRRGCPAIPSKCIGMNVAYAPSRVVQKCNRPKVSFIIRPNILGNQKYVAEKMANTPAIAMIR